MTVSPPPATGSEDVRRFVAWCYREHPGELAHVERVAAMARSEGDWIVAMLHDLVEDGFIGLDQLSAELGMLDLGSEDAARIVASVDCLTRREEEPYDHYIDRVARSGDRAAIAVKLLDLFDHLSPYTRDTLPERHRDRYVAAVRRLTAKN